jgi:hypothetical protein
VNILNKYSRNSLKVGRGVITYRCSKQLVRSVVVEALCYKPEGRGFETR